MAEDFNKADGVVDSQILVDFSSAEQSAKNFEKAVEDVDDRLTRLKSKLTGLSKEIGTALNKEASSISGAGIDSESVKQKVYSMINKAISQVNIDLGDIGKLTIDGDVLRSKVNAVYNSVIDQLYKGLSSLELSSIIDPSKLDSTNKLSATLKEEMSQLSQRISNVVVSELNKATIVGEDVKDINLTSVMNRIGEHIKQSLQGIQLPSIVIPQDDLAYIQNASDKLIDQIKSQLINAVSSVGKESLNGTEIQEAFEFAIKKLRTTLASSIESMLYIYDVEGLERNVKAAITEKLNTVGVKLNPLGYAIELDNSVSNTIMQKINAEINDYVAKLPVRMGAYSYPTGNIDNAKFSRLSETTIALDNVIKYRKDIIDNYVDQQVALQKAAVEAYSGSIEQIVKSEGGIAPNKAGFLKEEYSKIGKQFKNLTGTITADQMADIVSSQLGLKDFYAGDLLDYLNDLPKRKTRSRKDLKTEAAKYAKGVEKADSVIDEMQDDLIKNMESVLSPEDLTRLKTLSPENKVKVLSHKLNELKNKIQDVPEGYVKEIERISAEVGANKGEAINITAMEKQLNAQMSNIIKRLTDSAINSMKVLAERVGGEGADNATIAKINKAVEYSMDKFAGSFSSAIKTAARSSIVTETITQYIQGRLTATMNDIASKSNVKLPRIGSIVNTTMQLITENIETGIINSLAKTKTPKSTIKIDKGIYDALVKDIQDQINLTIANTKIPPAKPITITDGQLNGIINGIESVVHNYVNNFGRALALSPAMTVPTSKLSAKVKDSIMKMQGSLPDQTASKDVMSHLMLTEANAIEGAYSKQLRTMVKGYKTTITTDLEKINIEPNRELTVYFQDAMNDLQKNIYRRIQSILKAQMQAFENAISSTIVEPIRTLPNMQKKMDMYTKLAAPVTNTNRMLTQQAKKATNTAKQTQGQLERAMSGTGMHLISGALYSVPMYAAYAAKQAIVDVGEYESKMKQNIMTSPQAEVNGEMNRVLAESIYNTNFLPFMNQIAIKYGQSLNTTYEAGTIVTRKNRPMSEQKSFLNSVMKLYAIDEVDPEEGADILESVQAQFGLTTSELDGVIREIAAAVTMTQATGETIGEALKRSGSVGKHVGLETSDMIALTAVMAQATGQKGDVLGTFMKTALDRMSKKAVQPVLDRVYTEAFEKGLIDEKISVFDANTGKMTNPLKQLSVISELSTKMRDDDLFAVYRAVFGEWQKGRGMALVDQLAPEGGFENEGQANSTLKGYLSDLNTMLERVKGLTDRDVTQLMEINLDKPITYINRVNSAFQILAKSLADDGVMNNLKVFANAFTNILLSLSENSDKVMELLSFAKDYVVGMSAMGLGKRFVWGENGAGKAAYGAFMNGAFGSVDFSSGYSEHLTKNVVPLLTSGIRGSKTDYKNLLFGETFDLQNATSEETIMRAFNRRAEYMQQYNKIKTRLMRDGSYDSIGADTAIDKMVSNRMTGIKSTKADLEKSGIKVDSTVQKSLNSGNKVFDSNVVDVSWGKRLETYNSNQADMFQEVANGANKTKLAIDGLDKPTSKWAASIDKLKSTPTTLKNIVKGTNDTKTSVDGVNKSTVKMAGTFKGMNTVPSMLKQVGTGLLNMAGALTKAVGQMGLMLLLGKALEAVTNRIAENSLTEAQKQDKGSGDLRDLLNKYGNESEAEYGGFSTISKLLAIPTFGGSLFIEAGLSGDDPSKKFREEASNIYKGAEYFNDVIVKGKYRNLDYEGISEVFGTKIENETDFLGAYQAAQRNPHMVKGYKEYLQKQVVAETRIDLASDKSLNNLTEAEIDEMAQKEATKKINAGNITKSAIKTALLNAIFIPIDEEAKKALEKETAIRDSEMDAFLDNIQKSSRAINEGDPTDIDMDAGKNTTSKFLTTLRRKLSQAEDATSIKELQMRYKGYTEDSGYFRNQMVNAKQNELSEVQNQINQLKNYTPTSEDEGIEVQERIAELNRKMWETLVEIKELQESEYGTFNLPDGLKTMTDYEYYADRNTERRVAITSGDTYFNFTITGVDPKDKEAVKKTWEDVAQKTKQKNSESGLAAALSSQIRRGQNYGLW